MRNMAVGSKEVEIAFGHFTVNMHLCEACFAWEPTQYTDRITTITEEVIMEPGGLIMDQQQVEDHTTEPIVNIPSQPDQIQPGVRIDLLSNNVWQVEPPDLDPGMEALAVDLGVEDLENKIRH